MSAVRSGARSPRLLLSTPEVAERIGVSSRRAHALAERTPGFPKPCAVTAHGQQLWDPAAVDHWAETADRRPGRRWPAKDRRGPDA